MIPRIEPEQSLLPEVNAFFAEVQRSGFAGDIEFSYGSRLAVATDNSVYQTLPQGVLFPKSREDIQCVLTLANQDAFNAIRFSPRGGGTGTNGQSLTHGVVIDMSRYMNRVLEINAEEGWVRVESGVVKDALNDALRPHGYFFSPELSTSNRATIGGMINTDASGQGSLRYGKTSDHVLELDAVLMDGRHLHTAPTPIAALPESHLALYQAATVACVEHRADIEAKFPKLNRFLTGYDLKNAYSPDNNTLDLTRLLCGSEGSLAFITEAKLNITPIPKLRALLNIKYDSFESALRHAPALVEAQALSVETVDSRVLNLAKQDIVWHSVSDLITEVEGCSVDGLNIVEFADNDEANQTALITALSARLDAAIAARQDGVIGYQITHDLASINRVYGMRKKAVGLLGNAAGSKKPIAFTEDTCVPPEHLADFILEFRALLDQHQLDYGMFGHVDAGVLHVRPALDMCDPQQEVLLRKISDQVVALTAKYGGLMWGEHGKGYRSEYGPEFFGETLFNELRRIKAAFDPDNRLNPGKICTPLDNSDTLVSVDDRKRGYYDRQIPVAVRESFRQALDCNGNGLCFNYDLNSPMCPSMKLSADRRNSPKGRAGLVREWLRLLAEAGVDPIALEEADLNQTISFRQLIERFRNQLSKWRGETDFSHEVMASMKACLACKACASQCPINVDVPNFRSRFISLYYTRYLRPPRDYLVANIERMLPWMAKAPKLVNLLSQPGWIKQLTKATVGFADAPALTVPTLKQQLLGHEALGYTLEDILAIPAADAGKYVIVVQDPFTSYYDANVVSDFIRLIGKLGLRPILLPFKPNGKPEHVKGFMRSFSATARSTGQMLAAVAKTGIPLVGVDPALVLCYRDEYTQVENSCADQFRVLLVHEWLDSAEIVWPEVEPSQNSYTLLGHCTEKTALPSSERSWQVCFKRLGAVLTTRAVGCCGMAGTYGHEAQNLQDSRAIYDLSWAQAIAETPKEQLLTTGYSCRSQVKRYEGFKPKHPLQALLELL